MTKTARIGVLLAAATACLPLAGCGDDDTGDPIPGGKVATLENQLDEIRDDVDQDLCDEAIAAVNDARATVDSLDDEGVGADVQDALGDGVDNLGSLVSQDCEVEEEPETTPETVPETVPPPPTETVPPPTETVPPPTEEEPLPEPVPDPEEEPDEGDGGAQFDPDADIPPGQQKKLEDDD